MELSWTQWDFSANIAVQIVIFTCQNKACEMLVTEPHNQTCFLGEGIGYSKCVYLIYDGIHYDPLAVQSSDRTKEPLQTVFPVGDDMRLAEALEIAAGAKQVRMIDSNRNDNSQNIE